MSRYVAVWLVVLVGITSGSVSWAEKAASLKATLGDLGEPVVTESFDGPMSDTFRGVKGEWKAVDGVLMGKELASDKHAAVLNLQKPNRDSAIRVSFRFDGSTKGLNLSLNHKGGHLFRVGVSPAKLSVTLDKDKKDPSSKAVSLGSTKAKFVSGQWYTLQVEMKGDQVAVQTDNGATVTASHAKLETDKPNYRFVMRGDALELDDIQIWDWN